MICNTILEAMGHTPLVRLNRMVTADMAEILVKFEAINVGGSIKTRTAYNMIEDAERKGLLKPDSIIVEPTSGNQGIGLALVGAVKGYETVIVMPDSVSEERRKLVRHYGAKVVLVHDAGNIGAAIAECGAIAQRMAKENPRVFVPEQFSNPANPAVHRRHTALEILEQAARPIHGFCSGVGTGGTISGTGRYLKHKKPALYVVGVEPAKSPLLSGGKAGAHGLMGIGANFIPDALDRSVLDEVIPETEDDAYAMARLVAAKEGLLIGITSGAALSAAVKLAQREEFFGKYIVAIFPDSGERYLSTALFGE